MSDPFREEVARWLLDWRPVTRFRMEVEGYWTARCVLCGSLCGIAYPSPCAADRRQVVCSGPDCPGKVKDGTIVWERIEPEP